MADNKKDVGSPDRDRINLSEDYEVQDWSKKFGVSPDELRTAVQKVGSVAMNVEAYLKRKTTLSEITMNHLSQSGLFFND